MYRKILSYSLDFEKFYISLDLKTQTKIDYVLDLVRFEDRIPEKFFKHLTSTDGIYEIRIVTTFKSIRILCFIDGGNIIVLTNCFNKKSKRTPKKEIERAEGLKKKYLAEKHGGY